VIPRPPVILGPIRRTLSVSFSMASELSYRHSKWQLAARATSSRAPSNGRVDLNQLNEKAKRYGTNTARLRAATGSKGCMDDKRAARIRPAHRTYQ